MTQSEDTLKITTQMRKGILEYMILSIIGKWEAYASDILEKLKDNKLLVVEWTLYPLLSRLKDDGLISYYWVESSSGPPRKYFRLTDYGRETHVLMKHVWDELSNAVQNISQ
jgi:PadR family transcriptional regulator PadR